MQLAQPVATPPMQVVASVGSRTRGGASAQPTTLVADGPSMAAPAPTLDAAIAAAGEATRGAAVGAAAVFETEQGFVARAVRELSTGRPLQVERSRAAKPLVSGRMDVHDPTLRAIVDGGRIERMPDYAAATPEAWQDLRLLELELSNGSKAWSFSSQRRQGARTDASHFTKLGSDRDAAIARATRSVRSDYFHEALLLLRGDDGSYYMGGFTGGQGLLDEPGRVSRGEIQPSNRLAAVRATNAAVQAIVGARGIIDLRDGAVGGPLTAGVGAA
jgi:hypothetical protein